MLGSCAQIAYEHLDITGEQTEYRRPAAAIGNVSQVGAGLALDQFASEINGAADP